MALLSHFLNVGQYLFYDTNLRVCQFRRFIACSVAHGILLLHSGFSRGPVSNGGEFYSISLRKPSLTRMKSSSSIVPSFEESRR
jgi:hypothetical protein